MVFLFHCGYGPHHPLQRSLHHGYSGFTVGVSLPSSPSSSGSCACVDVMPGWQGGQHYIPNAWVHPAFSERGYHIVSTAYRFMPECSLEDQIDDLKDSFKWCREHLPSIVGAGTIDIETYVVAGDSAGGTHSTLMGHFLQPRPKVVIDVFGVVDMTDPVYWNVRPDFVPLPYIHPRNEQELDQHLKSRDKSQAVVTSAWRWELEPNLSVDRLRLFWGAPDYTPTDEKDFFRQDAYNYCNRIKHRMRILFRHEECANDEQVKERAKARSSLYLLDEATSYPPTFILHGTGDTAVPVEQSYRFVEKLKEKGIPCGAAYCPGGEHSFENAIEVGC